MSSKTNAPSSSSSSTSLMNKLQQQLQLRKDQIPLISRFIIAFKSQCVTLQKQRAQGVLIIQHEFREYLKRAGPQIHVMRQRRKEGRRDFLVGVDRIIKAAVESGRFICIGELRERKALYLDFVLSKMDELKKNENMKRSLVLEDEQEDREKLLEMLMTNVPRDVVPGTFEYDEFQARCHIARLEKFQRTNIFKATIAPKASFIHQFQDDLRNRVKMEELEERIDFIRASRAGIAEIQLFEIERLEERLRPAIEQERDIALCGMTQSRALIGLYLLLGPGEGSEHDTRIDLYHEQDAESQFLFHRMWEERTLLAAQFLLAEEQSLRNSRRGIPAIEAYERCQIVSKLYQMKLLLLQGEFSANDGLYVSSEAGSRRAIRWDEGRARDTIYQKAAATLHVALVPIEESRKRDTIKKSENEQALLLIQKVPAYYQQVLEPGARRGIFREWISWARSVTFQLFSITLQAIEEYHRTFIRRSSNIDVEFLAGAEYLEFLEKKHRTLITKEMSSRAIVADSVWRNQEKRRQQQQQKQQHHQHQKTPSRVDGGVVPSRADVTEEIASPMSLPGNGRRSSTSITASHEQQQPSQRSPPARLQTNRFSYNLSNSVRGNTPTRKTNRDFYYTTADDSTHNQHQKPQFAAASIGVDSDCDDYDDGTDFGDDHDDDGDAHFQPTAAIPIPKKGKVPPFFLKAVADMSPQRASSSSLK